MRKDRPRPETIQAGIDQAIKALQRIRPSVPLLLDLAHKFDRGFKPCVLGSDGGGREPGNPTVTLALSTAPDPAREIDDWLAGVNEAVGGAIVADNGLNLLVPRPESEQEMCFNCMRWGIQNPIEPGRSARCRACRAFRERDAMQNERPRELVLAQEARRITEAAAKKLKKKLRRTA